MQIIYNGDHTTYYIPQTFSDLTGNVSAGQLPSSGVPISNIAATGIASSSTYLRGDGSWSTPSGSGGMTWPSAAGIAVYSGSSTWGTSLTAPASAIVGIGDTQTLTNKTLTSPVLTTPALGTPASGTLTNCTFPTLNQNTTGSSGSCTGNSATATTASACSGNSATVTGLVVASGKTHTVNNSITLTGTDSTSFAFPGTSDTVVTLAASQTLTNKTLTSPTLTTPALGTPASGTLINCSGLPAANIVAGTMASGMTFVAPVLGTPASGTLTNCTFPTLNQNTTGTAGGLTGTPNITVGTATITALTNTIPVVNDLNGIHNLSTASQSQVTVAGTAYYITNSNLNMPAVYKTGIGAGTTFKWHIAMTKTAAGTGAFDIIIFMGTNGTTADTAEVTQSIGTQTAVVDNMTVDVLVSFTSATAFYWSIVPQNKAVTATGFGVTTGAGAFTSGTVTGLTTTTPSLKFGIGFKSVTGTPTIVIPMVESEAHGIS